MKKSVYLLGLILAFVSCAQETPEASNSTAIENSSLEELNAQKTSYTQQIEELTSKLETVNTAIAALGGSEKRALITAFATETSLFEHNIEVQANIKTRQNVLMYPEFAGRLIKLYVAEGQSVKKGALLAVIDDAGIQDQLEQMQLQLELAKTTFERTQRLWKQQIGSEMMFLEAQTRYKAAQKQVDQMKQQLAKTKIYAPFNGIIDEIPARLGSNLAPGVTPILRIVNLKSMYAEADVPETYLTNITKGSKAKVTIPVVNQTQTTTIQQTGNFITPSNRTFRVEAALENPENLIKPNLNARLSVVDYTNPEALMVPLRVIRENASGSTYVFILSQPEPDNGYTTEKRIVELGKSKQELIEVLTGLSPGDLIVDEGVSTLVEDQKVKRILE
ncbi:efflux RND transporter periplasmic adaptor subunit [Flavobacteriaceae bacterium]|nr:efflux RND transporter periplasmic adaptor subunit [Flavobacteriaceae bacterium]MDC0916792.1 efflux RND transporter periplasmic adaptor subunit [Flavobacteriaceae bacterium]MDC3329549.1 efflux RND transporter periplasmic adaptor subunit [Flavobacteriaceae bacterium]